MKRSITKIKKIKKITKITKSDLKKQLSSLGIKIVKSNYIRKKDIEKIVLAENTTPRVYVGTYGKYSSGSIDGAWLDLEDYADKEDFYEAAKELHKDEEDPEFMFQDFEGFPKRFYGESSLADELWDWLELDEDDRELLEVYIEDTGDGKVTIEQARDAFAGKYDSEEDWAVDFLEQSDIDPDTAANYLEISPGDIDMLSGEEADSYVENADDEDILKEADMLDEYDDEEDEKKKEKILEEAKEAVRESRAEEIKEKLEKDPVGYFVDETGMYSIEDLVKANFSTLDYKAYARDASHEGMSFARKGGNVWVFYPI